MFRLFVRGYLEDYILVEDFFLSKQLFNVGRDYTMISRFTPDINLELIFPIKHGPTTSTVIISFYRAVGVVTLTLNIVFEEIGTDDLIYIKSLKWNSIRHYDKAPMIDVVINGDCRKDQYFCDIFKLIWDEVFKDKLEIKLESESILDLIEIRDGVIGGPIFRGKRNDLLFGLLVGDEGHSINSSKMMDERISRPDKRMEYRDYFKYFFESTTILGLFSKDYPKCGKKEFAKVYADRYSDFKPLCEYINLVSDIANLSDGLALVGEVTLVRYTVLKEIDQNIRTEFEGGKMRLKHLLRLKNEIITRMTTIELLAKDVLWINLLSTTDEMFGYNSIKKNMQERLGYIDSQIRDEYNSWLMGLMLLLTAVIGLANIPLGVWLWRLVVGVYQDHCEGIDWFISICKYLFLKI